mgnify:CR=1 FL=1
MKFTLMSYHYLRYPLRAYLDKMERLPLDGLDLYCVAPQLNPFDYRLGDLIQLDRDIKARHLTPYVLTAENCAYPVNLATSNTVTWESTVRYYQRLIDTAAFLDAPNIQVCPGSSYFDDDVAAGWDRQVKAFQQLTTYARRKGVNIFLETCKTTTTNLIVTSKELARFIADVGADNLLGLSDTDQMALAGETIDDYIDNLGNRYGFVHFSDSDHTIPGTGNLPMKKYYEALIRRDYHGWISSELCSRDYYRNPDMATDLYINYLRSTLGAWS